MGVFSLKGRFAMKDQFDEEFVQAAAISEPPHRERARPPGWYRRRQIRRRWRRSNGGGRRWRATPSLAFVCLLVSGVAATAVLSYTSRGRSVDAVPPGPANPFAGSPAAAYANGADGVTPPAATAMGGFSPTYVRAALTSAKRLVEAAGLDHATLLGGTPRAFATALDPQDRKDFLDHLSDRTYSTRNEVATMVPGSAELVGGIIKVHGTMTITPAKREGQRGLDVKVDYLFVYPIQRPRQSSTLLRLVARLTGTQFYFQQGGHARTWLEDDWGTSATPARCDTHDGFIHPDFDSTTPDTAQPSGPPLDPYDQSRPDPTGGECEQSSGT
jgi:hypothetical protein